MTKRKGDDIREREIKMEKILKGKKHDIPTEKERLLYRKFKKFDKIIKRSIILFCLSGLILSGWFTITWILAIEKIVFLYLALVGLLPLGVGLSILVASVEKIEKKPPHVALVSYREERIPIVKKEGLRSFFKYFPIFYNYISINIEKKNQDLPAETIRTPDLGLLKTPISITWTPGAPPIEGATEEENSIINGKYLINYINHGEEEGEKGNEQRKGIRAILPDIVRERVREWGMSPIEGPQDYKQALGAQQAAVAILLKAIAGEDLEPKIPYQEIPTSILMCYFNHPPIPPTEEQRKRWGSEEKGKEEKWTKIDEAFKRLGEENKEKIRKLVEERKENIKRVQRGNGTQRVFALGITINRLNIGEVEIHPDTELAKMAGQKAAQEERLKARSLRVNTVREMIESLTKRKLGESDFTPQEARDIVQTEGIDETRVSKEIKDYQGLKALGEGIGEILKRR